MTTERLPRRAFLVSTAVATGGLLLSSTAAPLPAQGAPVTPGEWSSSKTENGWPVLVDPRTFAVEGSGQAIGLASEAAPLLVYVARRFHYEIDQLRPGDLTGHSTSTRTLEDYESNHLSGTALTIRASAYPAGASGGFFPVELAVIEDVLAELEGAVVWGGHFKRPKESHFQVAHRPGHPIFDRAARRIASASRRTRNGAPGATDAFNPERRRAALAYRAALITR